MGKIQLELDGQAGVMEKPKQEKPIGEYGKAVKGYIAPKPIQDKDQPAGER